MAGQGLSGEDFSTNGKGRVGGRSVAAVVFLLVTTSVLASMPSVVGSTDKASHQEPTPPMETATGRLFHDTFPTTSINNSNWNFPIINVNDGCGSGASAPFSAHFIGGTVLTSIEIDLAASPRSTLELWIKHGDDSGTPVCEDTVGNDNLAIEYHNSTGNWNCLFLYSESGAATFAHVAPFLADTTYTVVIASTASSVDGFPLPADFTFSFRTSATSTVLPQSIQAAALLVVLLAILTPLVFLLYFFIFRRRPKKDETEDTKRQENPKKEEEPAIVTPKEEIEKRPGDSSEKSKEKKPPKEVNPWERLEE